MLLPMLLLFLLLLLPVLPLLLLLLLFTHGKKLQYSYLPIYPTHRFISYLLFSDAWSRLYEVFPLVRPLFIGVLKKVFFIWRKTERDMKNYWEKYSFKMFMQTFRVILSRDSNITMSNAVFLWLHCSTFVIEFKCTNNQKISIKWSFKMPWYSWGNDFIGTIKKQRNNQGELRCRKQRIQTNKKIQSNYTELGQFQSWKGFP